MPKIPITPELVERFGKLIIKHGWRVLDETPGQIRQTLDELLNPPEPPQIPVSDTMRLLGGYCINRLLIKLPEDPVGGAFAESVYREMESQRRKETPDPILPLYLGGHAPSCEGAHMFINPIAGKWYHCTCNFKKGTVSRVPR